METNPIRTEVDALRAEVAQLRHALRRTTSDLRTQEQLSDLLHKMLETAAEHEAQWFEEREQLLKSRGKAA